jgi:hypothetical protein
MKLSVNNRKALLTMAVLLVCAFILSACGGDQYATYSSAYKKLWANGGIDATISADLKMDGITNHYDGNFKVDNTKDILYYEMKTANGSTVQFSDGSYLYTQQGDHKIKYSLKPSGDNGEPTVPENESGEGAPEFSSSEFLEQFSSMFEASKIKDLGLFDPIPQAAVVKTTKNGDVYTLDVSDSIVKKFVNTLAVNQAGTDDTVQVTDLKNFKYTATIKNGVVTETTFAGDVIVNVPASLTGSGAAKDYSVNMDIKITFNNAGQLSALRCPIPTVMKKSRHSWVLPLKNK